MKPEIALPAFHITETTPFTVEADHPLTEQLRYYREFYRQVYGAAVSEADLLAEMARRFMEGDREFHTFLKKAKRPAKKAHKSRPSNSSRTSEPLQSPTSRNDSA